MTSATVTSKGQITIPADVRTKLGLRPGSRLSFTPTGAGGYEIRAEGGSVRELEGIIEPPERPVTLDDMDAAIAEGALRSMG